MTLISTLTEDFSAGSLDTTTKWAASSGSGIGINSFHQGYLVANTGATSYIGTSTRFDLSSSAIYFQMIPPDTTGNTVVSITLKDPGANTIGLNSSNKAAAYVNGVFSFNITLDTNNTWFKIVDYDGLSLAFYYSTDGLSWVEAPFRQSYTDHGIPTIDITQLRVIFQAWTLTTYGTTQYALLDNINTAPAAITPGDTSGSSGSSMDDFNGDSTKRFQYKVYDSAGTYIGSWKDVTDEPEFTQQINSPGTTTTVHLARSPDTRIETRDVLIDDAGNTYTDEAGNTYATKAKVTNVVGSGTDIDLNYSVDIYVIYGGYDTFVDTLGNTYTDEAGNTYALTMGAPTGRRIFSGFILDYELDYDSTDGGVIVTLASNGYELSQNVIKSPGTETTTVTYSSQDSNNVVKAILDTNPGKMGYTSASLPASGTNIAPTFRLNTKLEGIETAVQQAGNLWWYGNPSDNLVYAQPKASVADHTFVLGKHIFNLRLKRTMEGLINDFYFVGGDPGSGQLYRHYTNSTSLTAWRRGIDRHTDQRYTLTSSIDNYAAKRFTRYAQPIYTTTITISAATYDIENIKLGQVVQFRGTDSFADTLLLQIVNLSYTPYKVTLDLGEVLDSQAETISDIEQQADTTAQIAIPSTPS